MVTVAATMPTIFNIDIIVQFHLDLVIVDDPRLRLLLTLIIIIVVVDVASLRLVR